MTYSLPVGCFGTWNTFQEVVLWRSCVWSRAASQRGTCVFWEQDCFPLLKKHKQAAAHSASTVLKGFLSMLLCAHRELFPLPGCIEGWVGKKHANRWPLTTPCTPIHVCVQREKHTLKGQCHATAQDVYLLPVFVRKFLGVAMETKYNIEKSPLSLCREKPVHRGEPGPLPHTGCCRQTVSDDTWQRQGVL